MGKSMPVFKAMEEHLYRPCLDLQLLCEIYGCDISELSVLLSDDKEHGQNLIYYDKWGWNIAYEETRRPCQDSGYYGNPFYDFFSSEGGYQWTSQSHYWSPDKREDYNWTPEESVKILNAFTEIMHWRDMEDHARYLGKMAKLAFEGVDTPQRSQEFQKFLKDREKKLITQGKW